MTDILFNGFTYSGDVVLSLFNYILIALTFSPFLSKNLKEHLTGGVIVLVIAFCVQILLWFLFYAQGVSVVWNFLVGALILSAIKIKLAKINISLLSIYIILPVILASNIYFGLIFPFITTAAHISSILLGALSGSFIISVKNK